MTAQTIENHVLASVADNAKRVIDEVRRVYVGSTEIPELMLTALLARGHALLEGVPGVAKTTLCKAFAQSLDCGFRRIQFTPDLLPADITGTYILDPKEGAFELRLGPIFSNVVLGDEINRAPAKTQSALLEAMGEHQVTIEGETHSLPTPFIVLATQNPVEQAGTYALPEAQIDRFLLRVAVGYPSAKDEVDILKRFTEDSPTPQATLQQRDILTMQQLVDQVFVEHAIHDYVVRITRFTRSHTRLFLGASPRASLALVRGARARALIRGRAYVIPDDIKALASPILAHRLVLTPEAEMEGVHTENIVSEALKQTPHRTER